MWCLLAGGSHRGKFGEVKRCEELTSGREFAAKFIATPRPQDRKDVEREVAMMCRLHHRRLVQLYDAFQSDKEMCLLIEMYEISTFIRRVGRTTQNNKQAAHEYTRAHTHTHTQNSQSVSNLEYSTDMGIMFKNFTLQDTNALSGST